MVTHARLDRREFLALSALTSVATLLPESVYATQSSETDRVSLEVTGDAQHGYGLRFFIAVVSSRGTIRAGNSQPSSKTTKGVSKTGSMIGKQHLGKATEGRFIFPEKCNSPIYAQLSLSKSGTKSYQHR